MQFHIDRGIAATNSFVTMSLPRGEGEGAVLAAGCGRLPDRRRVEAVEFPRRERYLCARGRSEEILWLPSVVHTAGILANIDGIPTPVHDFLPMKYTPETIEALWKEVVASRLEMSLKVLK